MRQISQCKDIASTAAEKKKERKKVKAFWPQGELVVKPEMEQRSGAHHSTAGKPQTPEMKDGYRDSTSVNCSSMPALSGFQSPEWRCQMGTAC